MILLTIDYSTILLTCTPLNLPIENLFIRTYFLWSSVGVFSFYGNIFCLRESLFIYDHLWGSFLFMRISSYLWSSVRIFSIYENLFLFMISVKIFPFYENLFESLLIYHNLFQSLLFLSQYFWIFLQLVTLSSWK